MWLENLHDHHQGHAHPANRHHRRVAPHHRRSGNQSRTLPRPWIRSRLADEMRILRGSNAKAVLATIVPIVRGWTVYYRGVVSKRVFTSMDDHMWKLTYKWANYSHQNKPKTWIIHRYYGQFNPARLDRWVFGDRDSGAYLPHADREPASPREWEEWLTGTRKAIARHNLAADGHVGTDDIRLVHSSCHRRDSGADARRNGTSAHLKRPLRLA